MRSIGRSLTRVIGTLVRYADDLVVLCRSEAEAQAAQQLAGEILAGLGLELHPEKTRMVDLREGREGFDFLGCHFQSPRVGSDAGARRSPLLPSSLALTAGDETHPCERSRPRPARGRAGQDIREVIADLNPVLRGWGNYFRTGNAAKKFNQIDRYVGDRLWRPDAQALWPQLATRPSRDLDARMV